MNTVKNYFPQTPDELLKSASQSAQHLLPVAEQELEDAKRLVEEKTRTVTHLRALAAFSEHVSRSDASLRASTPLPLTLMQNAAADVGKDIESALTTYGPLKAPVLRELIYKHYGRTWGESTIYSYLSKGKATGKYLHENNQWSLASQGEQNSAGGSGDEQQPAA